MIETRSGKYNAPTPMIRVPFPSLSTLGGGVREKEMEKDRREGGGGCG